jgi:hypothetical protein
MKKLFLKLSQRIITRTDRRQKNSSSQEIIEISSGNHGIISPDLHILRKSGSAARKEDVSI